MTQKVADDQFFAARTMADAFARIKEKAEKEAARAAAQEAKAAEKEAAAEAKAAERQAKAQTLADQVLNLGASPESKEGGESAGDDTQV